MNIKETFQKAVKDAVNGDKRHGWGVADSMAVITALLVEETGGTADDLKTSGLLPAIQEVVNPSQFRQKLESAHILDKAPTKTQRAASLLAGIDEA